MVKQPPIKFSTICPATDVLEAFIAKGQKMPVSVAMVACKNIVERIVLERAEALILPQIADAYDMQCLTGGTPGGNVYPDDLELWSEEMDNAIEALLDSYYPSITQDLIGQLCASTRFHIEPLPGMKPEANVIAEKFAKDVWRVLIHDTDEDAEPPRVLSTAKILSAVGIVADDLKEIMGDLSQDAPTVATEEDLTMPRTMIDILNDLHANFVNDDGTLLMADTTLAAYFEMAIDSDAGLSLSGCAPLCLDYETDAATLRQFAKDYGADAPQQFVAQIAAGPYDTTDSASDVTVGAADDEDAEMAALMGMSAPPAAPSVPSPPSASAAPSVPAFINKRPPGVAVPAIPGSGAGPIDKRVFTLVRQHVKLKDDDVAAGIGVSRQTYINYADPAKKAVFIANAAQHAFLSKIVKEAIAGLDEAGALLGLST